MSEFVQRFDDDRGKSGVGSALMFRKQGESKYHLFLPLETTPYVFGETSTLDYDLTTSPFISKVKGKTQIDSKDVDFIAHRDTIERLKEFKGLMLDFLAVGKDFTAQRFTAEYTFRLNDQSSSEVDKGTITLIPSRADEPIIDCRDLLQPTVVFTNSIPAEVVLATATSVVNVTIETNVAGATITPTSSDTGVTVAYASGKVTITGVNASTTNKIYAIVKIVASNTGYANWATHIAVEVPVAV